MLVPKMVNGVQEVKDGKLVWIDENGNETFKEEDTTPPATPPTSTGDQYMTQEAVNELLAKVRKEEKEKLYPQIERANDKIGTLEALVKSLQEQLNNKDVSATTDKKKIIDENTQLSGVVNQLQEQINNLTAELQRQRDEAAAEKRQLVLDNYKERKLREAGDEIIPELVYGNSEAEIDQAIANSRKRYRELLKKEQAATATATATAIQQTPGAGPTAPPPEIPDALTDVDREAIKHMNPEQLREYKRKLGIPLSPSENSIAGKRGGRG